MICIRRSHLSEGLEQMRRRDISVISLRRKRDRNSGRGCITIVDLMEHVMTLQSGGSVHFAGEDWWKSVLLQRCESEIENMSWNPVDAWKLGRRRCRFEPTCLLEYGLARSAWIKLSFSGLANMTLRPPLLSLSSCYLLVPRISGIAAERGSQSSKYPKKEIRYLRHFARCEQVATKKDSR